MQTWNSAKEHNTFYVLLVYPIYGQEEVLTHTSMRLTPSTGNNKIRLHQRTSHVRKWIRKQKVNTNLNMKTNKRIRTYIQKSRSIRHLRYEEKLLTRCEERRLSNHFTVMSQGMIKMCKLFWDISSKRGSKRVKSPYRATKISITLQQKA